MTAAPPQPVARSPWPHRLAVLLVCATFPLIWVGGLVTTTKAGMAVPDWPSTFGYNLFLYPWQTWLFGPWDLFIEHGHRLFASGVGMITIALVIAVWRGDRRRWMKWLALGALALVIGQGVLGGMRVLLDERTLAMIHGCVGPAFFAMAVAIAVFTSRFWTEGRPRRAETDALSLQVLAAATTILAYLQLVLGAQLRHMAPGAPPSLFRAAVMFHLFVAAVLLVHSFLLMARVFRRHRCERSLTRPALGLAILVVFQIVLGGMTWIAKYAWPGWTSDYNWTAAYTISAGSLAQATIVTAHVATGSLILAVSLLAMLRSLRLYRPAPRANASLSSLMKVAV